MRTYPIFPGQLDWLLRLYIDCHQAFLDGKPVDQALSAAFRKAKQMGSKDRRFYSTALFGLYRYWGWLLPVNRQDPMLALYLAYQLEGEIPSEIWSKRLGQPVATAAPLGLDAKLALVLPFNAKAKLNGLVPSLMPSPDRATLEALQARPRLWVRIQKAGPFTELLAKGQLEHQRHPLLPDAVLLDKPMDLKPYRGEVEIQDLSSQAVGHLCAPQPGQSWLDLCAGAGGKSLHLFSLMKGQGRLTLADPRQEALDEAQRRFEAAQYGPVEFCWIGDDQDPLPNEAYDGVLADVPCSGSGTWHRAPWLRWQLKEAKLGELNNQQEHILNQAAHKTKPGGLLVYSTCSILTEENQAITANFLARHRNFALEPYKDPISGLEQPGQHMVLPQDSGGNGMYFCRMRRHG
ncbi:MAG: RsmB/NOP family class I SAM-dependent RNA methyltransferase [bacterium]|nr:RsmB/NOP family class I SAM-dependent RNA methyltransferase [bacterium]